MGEVIVGRIGHDLTVDIQVSIILPLGPTDGVYCGEYCVGLLRLLSTDLASVAEIKIYSYDKLSNSWIEDPSERRTLDVGEDYTRPFDVRAVDRMIIKLVSKTGTYNRIWTFA